jgi:hypothetical protein
LVVAISTSKLKLHKITTYYIYYTYYYWLNYGSAKRYY